MFLRKEKFNSVLLAEKFMAVVIWIERGGIHVKFLRSRTTVNAACYIETLQQAFILVLTVLMSHNVCLKLCFPITTSGHTQVCTPLKPLQILDGPCCHIFPTVMIFHHQIFSIGALKGS
jgi:hypothetical protein